MAFFIVTVKLPKNPDHDPHNKKTGQCPASHLPAQCTDVTGEHHSLLISARDLDNAVYIAKSTYNHVTRVEEV